MNKLYIGIDVSKNKLDVFIISEYLSFKNNESGFKQLLKKFKTLQQNIHCICESTGSYHLKMALFLAENNIDISIVNALRIKNFIRSFSESAKTDKSDAEKLSIYGQERNPSPWIAPNANKLYLKSLVKRREDLVHIKSIELQHLESEQDKKVQKHIEKMIRYLEMQIASLDSKIDEEIDKDSIMKEKRKLLEEVKGLGKVSAYNILMYLPELGTISRGAVAAIVGVAPYNQDSGLNLGKRKIRGGRKSLRDKLYMPTLCAMRSNDIIKKYAERLISKGKAFKVVLIACMRKLLIHLNAKIKTFNQKQSISL